MQFPIILKILFAKIKMPNLSTKGQALCKQNSKVKLYVRKMKKKMLYKKNKE
jgi:hypothetical protein